MKACIITGHPSWVDGLNPQTEAMWKTHLSNIPEITSYDLYNVYGKSMGELLSYIGDADILVGLPIGPYLNDEFFTKYPRLKYIATLSMGYGEFDREVMKRHNVSLSCTLYGAQTIAQFSMALLLDLCHNIGYNSQLVSSEPLLEKPIIIEKTSRQIELYGKTLGIIGLGNVSLWVARMASAFGMKVIGNSRTIKTCSEYDIIEQVSIDELYKRSDVISLNCSENPSTKGIINKDTIAKMKDGVILINTARASLVVEEDLLAALTTRKVYAAGLDATSYDNIRTHIPLMDNEYTRVTAHIAWFPMEARLRDINVAAENLKNYIKGTPTGIIS